MDRNLHDDYFERFLRDSVEDFRMIPSRRVWTSLYNNLHPGKKYPSLAVCVFLLSAIIYIGLNHSSNRNQAMASGKVLQKGSQVLTSGAGSDQDLQQMMYAATSLTDNSDNQPADVLVAGSDVNNTQADRIAHQTGTTPQPTTHQSNRSNQPTASSGSQHTRNRNAISTDSEHSGFAQRARANNRTRRSNRLLAMTGGIPTEADNRSAINHPVSSADANSFSMLSAWDREENGVSKQTNLSQGTSLALTDAKRDREFIDHYAFYNKRKSGFKDRLAFQIYATPSIGFRQMNSNADLNIMTNNLSNAGTSLAGEKDHSVVQSPALNLEAGYSLIYSLNKTFRIKGGMQFNYSNFYVQAQPLDHPMGASLSINGPNGQLQTVYKSSSIANNPMEDNARQYSNNSFQLSLPIGADIRLAGNSKLQWFAGATIQPTYILTGNAFLLSDDNKNYIFDANFVRKWNLNAGVETFVTYKVNKGVMINAGPQFRYQFRSSFIDQYTYDVKMYNLGIKLGIVQQF